MEPKGVTRRTWAIFRSWLIREAACNALFSRILPAIDPRRGSPHGVDELSLGSSKANGCIFARIIGILVYRGLPGWRILPEPLPNSRTSRTSFGAPTKSSSRHASSSKTFSRVPRSTASSPRISRAGSWRGTKGLRGSTATTPVRSSANRVTCCTSPRRSTRARLPNSTNVRSADGHATGIVSPPP